jgi:hypothetical protein
VALVRDGQELRVETFLLLPDEGTQEATAFWDRFSHDTLWIGGDFNVGISGDIGRRVMARKAPMLRANRFTMMLDGRCRRVSGS